MDSQLVYSRHAQTYDELVSYEDCDRNLLAAIQSSAALHDRDVVELGAGTGRVSRLVAPHVRSLLAFDRSSHMLQVARTHLQREGRARCALAIADNAQLPLGPACADVTIAGWTFGHQTVWNESGWQAPIEAALREMLRVLRPGGTAVIIETLGTGHSEPFDPPVALKRYYQLLEQQWGFERRWIRTDYEFATLQEGERLVRFFFGDETARQFVSAASRRLVECTGVWSRRK